jgi:nitroimidazol reductase NimA-like FMN-containing flavoprotein (pyridoxamine 5'-phosphate oxidase superfamily)
MTDHAMRRDERRVRDPEDVAGILAAATIAHVGFVEAGEPYVVPLNFGCEFDGHRPLRFWFHSAPAGRKARLIAASPRVCVEVDVDRGLKTHPDHACTWTQRYESVMAWGTARAATDAGEQRHGLEVLMRAHSGRDGWSYPDRMLAETLVWCVEIERWSAKAHVVKPSATDAPADDGTDR